jgi:hypothetical protein
VSPILELPAPFVLLLPLSLAAGVDFFLTLLVLALSIGPGFQDGPALFPDALHWSIPAFFLAFYLIEAAAELRPFPALLWHTGQLIFRPLGGGLLAMALLDGLSPDLQVLGALAGGVVCAFTHVLSWGRKLLGFLASDPRPHRLVGVFAEDALVLGFLFSCILAPKLAFGVSAPLLILGLLLGGPLHQVARFGLFLARARTLGLLDPPGWRGSSEMPVWIGTMKVGDETSRRRGLPAGALGFPGFQGFREGWMVESGGRRWFVTRRRGRPEATPLPPFHPGDGMRGDLALMVPVPFPEKPRSALFLQRIPPSAKSHK